MSCVTPRSIRDGVVFGAPGDFGWCWVAAFAVFTTSWCVQRRDLADAGDIATVPFDPELEVLIGVETFGVDW